MAAATLAVAPLSAQNGDDELRRLTEEARKTSGQLLSQIRGEVAKEMEHGGPLRATVVCKYSVPEITSAVSRRHGMRVARVSLRPRNPSLAIADPWEQKVLLDFERRVARGEKAEGLEFAELVAEPQGRFFRYLKAIAVAQPCMQCHGPADSMSEAIKAQLGVEYPHDGATGYNVGQVLGGVSVKRPM